MRTRDGERAAALHAVWLMHKRAALVDAVVSCVGGMSDPA
jgi:hypothetical protein